MVRFIKSTNNNLNSLSVGNLNSDVGASRAQRAQSPSGFRTLTVLRYRLTCGRKESLDIFARIYTPSALKGLILNVMLCPIEG